MIRKTPYSAYGMELNRKSFSLESVNVVRRRAGTRLREVSRYPNVAKGSKPIRKLRLWLCQARRRIPNPSAMAKVKERKYKAVAIRYPLPKRMVRAVGSSTAPVGERSKATVTSIITRKAIVIAFR